MAEGTNTIARICALVSMSVFAGCDWPGRPNPAARPIPAEEIMDFADLYSRNCAGCHGADGKGLKRSHMNELPDFTDADWQSSRGDADLQVSILEGKGTHMPSFADSVSETQAQQLVAYIRQLGGRRAARKEAPSDEAPQTVALYLSDLARTHKVSTLYRRLSGISQAHQAAGFSTPTTDAQVRLVFQGIRPMVGSAPEQGSATILAEGWAMVEEPTYGRTLFSRRTCGASGTRSCPGSTSCPTSSWPSTEPWRQRCRESG